MAEAADSKKKEGKVKKPSALKRDLQNEKQRKKNRSYRSSVHTAVRSLETALVKKEGEVAVKEKLSTVYRLMDKGVKKGIYKPNQAARKKSRLTSRLSKSV